MHHYQKIVLCAALLLNAAISAAADSQTLSTETFAPSADGQIFYELVKPAKPDRQWPVVLIAGGPGGNHTLFKPWFDALSRDHTTVYFDQIDRGRSAALPAGKTHSVPRDAQDIEALRVALGLERLILLGNSYGALPAIEYALTHPERVACMVLSVGMHSDASFQAHIKALNDAMATQYPAHWKRLQALYASGVKSGDPAYQSIYGEVADQLYWFDPRNAAKRWRSPDPRDRFNANVYVAFMGDDSERTVSGALKGYDPRTRMKALTMPTLIVTGRRDVVATPQIAEQTQAAFPSGVATLSVIELAGHRPFIEQPHAYFDVLKTFLSTTPQCARQR
jgi:proline iminopeptidase